MVRRLLIVDDEPRNLLAIEGLLAPLGHLVARASSGLQALGAIEANVPDLILLDWRMPGMDGLEVLRRLRASEAHRHVPVIMVTACGDRDDRLRALDAGADEFLEKPLDTALLLARVRLVLRLRDATDAAHAHNRALESQRREQRELAAFIVHDLRTPITVAHTNVNFVRAHTENARHRESLDDASEALSRLRRMAHDLLAISRLEQTGMPLRRESIAVRPLLDAIARAHGREAAKKQIAVTVRGDEDVRVDGDCDLLRRMVENVLANALRHTPFAGRIDLAAASGDPVEIAIANSGAPVSASDRTRIFEKNVRGAQPPSDDRTSSAVDERMADRVGHLGLGLYFCKRAAEVHGGAIDLRHSAEWPTSFVIRLPAP